MMNLYFLRHAKAFPRSPKWKPDSKRPLTKQGEERMRAVACGMRELKLSFDVILTSPYARALATAQIAHEALGGPKPIVVESLVPEADPQQIIDEISRHHGAAREVALVGHEPFMSHLMSLLLAGAPHLQIDFKKAGLSRLSIETLQLGKCACLEWLLTPRQLAQLGNR